MSEGREARARRSSALCRYARSIRVLVAAPPKTGNVWIERILSLVYELAWLRLAPPCDFWGGANARGLMAWTQEHLPDGSVVHQHYWPEPDLFEVVDQLGITLVTTLRNPYDQFVSLYFYVQRFPDSYTSADDPAAAMIGRPLDHRNVVAFLRGPFRRYLEHGVAWLESGRTRIVRYEALAETPIAAVTRLTSSIEPVTSDRVKWALVESAPERMRRLGSDLQSHIRSARVGDGLRYLSDEHLVAMREHGELIARLGYHLA